MTDQLRVLRDGSGEAADVYLGFLDAINHQDLEAAERFVDVGRYRECRLPGGFVPWTGAKASLQEIWQGLPDLRVELR
ncbi:MAG: hypothetical protein H0V96_02335 [Acidimicrobiia bacterium]|nr:hypothetical protein [Acidimicrobiia bacterium]